MVGRSLGSVPESFRRFQGGRSDGWIRPRTVDQSLELMVDCWKHVPNDRPTIDAVLLRAWIWFGKQVESGCSYEFHGITNCTTLHIALDLHLLSPSTVNAWPKGQSTVHNKVNPHIYACPHSSKSSLILSTQNTCDSSAVLYETKLGLGRIERDADSDAVAWHQPVLQIISSPHSCALESYFTYALIATSNFDLPHVSCSCSRLQVISMWLVVWRTIGTFKRLVAEYYIRFFCRRHYKLCQHLNHRSQWGGSEGDVYKADTPSKFSERGDGKLAMAGLSSISSRNITFDKLSQLLSRFRWWHWQHKTTGVFSH